MDGVDAPELVVPTYILAQYGTVTNLQFMSVFVGHTFPLTLYAAAALVLLGFLFTF